MAKVIFLSLAPTTETYNSFHRAAFTRIQGSAEIDILKLHTLTDDPKSADLIIFAEVDGLGLGQYFEKVRKHPYVKNFREKYLMFCQTDRPIAFLPGVYASIGKNWYSSARTRSRFYLSVAENELITFRVVLKKIFQKLPKF